MHKIHTPPLRRSGWRWSGASVQRDMLPPPHMHPQLQPLQPIQSSDAFMITHPSLAAQQHPDAQIPKPWPGLGEITNPYPQGGLILRAASSIPGGTTELGQPTSPQATDLKGAVKPGGQLSAACGP